MKVNTILPKHYTATYMDFEETVTGDGGGVLRSYFDVAEPITFRFSVDMQLRRPVLYTEERLKTFARVRNITDAGGAVISEGVIWEIKQELPLTNAFGFSEGYQYLLSRVA